MGSAILLGVIDERVVVDTLHYITKWPLPQKGGAPVKGPT